MLNLEWGRGSKTCLICFTLVGTVRYLVKGHYELSHLYFVCALLYFYFFTTNSHIRHTSSSTYLVIWQELAWYPSTCNRQFSRNKRNKRLSKKCSMRVTILEKCPIYMWRGLWWLQLYSSKNFSRVFGIQLQSPLSRVLGRLEDKIHQVKLGLLMFNSKINNDSLSNEDEKKIFISQSLYLTLLKQLSEVRQSVFWLMLDIITS